MAKQAQKPNLIKEQLTQQINASANQPSSQIENLQQSLQATQAANSQLTQGFQPPSQVMQNMSTQSKQLQQIFQQQSLDQKLQDLQQMTSQFQLEIGKMSTEYNDLASANMNQTKIQQTMQQKANALQKFNNEINQKLTNL